LTTKEIIEASNLSLNARELVPAGPEAEQIAPERFVALLQQHSLFQDAVSFRAHELAVGPAIRWAAACIEELRPPDKNVADQESLASVERWLDAPQDTTRWAAKAAADKAGISSPADCLAMAVFLSGGSIAPPGAPDVPPPPYTAQKMAAGSITVAVVSYAPEKAAERFGRALSLSFQQKLN
jgi:hypothetical protein